MTPFKRRPHLRIAGALADDTTTDADVTADPATTVTQPPPPRTVQAQASDLMPDVPTTPVPAAAPKYGEMILNGIFVGIGYGLASEILKVVLGGGRSSSRASSGLSGVHRRRKSLGA